MLDDLMSHTDELLADILSTILEQPVTPGQVLRRADVAKWDSLKHLEIVFAVEAAFEVAFTAEEIAQITGSEDLKAKVSASHAP